MSSENISSENISSENIVEEVFNNTPEIDKSASETEEENISNESVDEEGSVSDESVDEEGSVSDDEEESVSDDEEESVTNENIDKNVIETGEDENANKVGEENIKELMENKDNTLNVAKNNAIAVVNNILENINNGLININAIFSKKNKKINQINGNIKNMLDYQDNLYEDEKYIEYLNYLKLFYERDNKKSIYKKSYENNNLILSSKDKRIVITPSVVVDLDNYKTYLEKEVHNVLFDILQLIEKYSMNNVEEKERFNKLKNIYITFKSQLNDIKNIEETYFEKMIKIEEDISTLSVQLNVMKEERLMIYQQIKTKIINEVKEKLITSFKDNNNKIPDTTIIAKISTDYQIPIEDVELWLQWIEKSYLYLNAEINYSKNIKMRYIEEENFKNLTKNFILQKPQITFS